MAIDTVKLINYLAYGVSHTQISTALAISPARVSQLSADPKVIDLVAARKAEISIEELERKADLKTAAATLLGTIVELAGDTESLGEAVRAYEILDKLSRTNDSEDGARTRPGKAASTLIVQVPIFVQQALQIETNSKNEIVELAGRSMATLNTKDTYALLNAQANQQRDSIDEQESAEEEW